MQGLDAEKIGVIERVANLTLQHTDNRRYRAALIFQAFEFYFH